MENLERVKVGLEKWIKFDRIVKINRNIVGRDSLDQLNKFLLNLSNPLNILIAGEFNAGKSTFINSLLGYEVLVSDVTPATSIITKITYGKNLKLLVHKKNGQIIENSYSTLKDLTSEGSKNSNYMQSDIKWVEVQLPVEILKICNLIDSPGVTSLHKKHTSITEEFFKEADAAIWLFNSLNVGTSSEMDWLKNLHNKSIPIFGLVNGIDRLEEEEDLNSFYEYNERRLYPYIKNLNGISAKDILEGKLSNNKEMIEWGNEEAVHSLFSNLIKMKMDNFYQEFQIPLNNFYESFILNEKANMYFFLRDDFADLLQSKKLILQKIGKTIIELQNDLDEKFAVWEPYISSSEWIIENPHSVILLMESEEDLLVEWNKKVKPRINALEQRNEEMVRAMRKIELKKLLMEESYKKIERVFLKLIQTLRYFKEENQYNEKIEEMKTNLEFLKKDYEELDNAVLPFKKILIESIEKDLRIEKEEINNLKFEWNNQISKIKVKHAEWSLQEIAELEERLTEYKEFKETVLPYFLKNQEDISESYAYGKIAPTLNKLNMLYEGQDTSENIDFYLKVASYKFKNPRKLSIVTENTWESSPFIHWQGIPYKKNKGEHFRGLGPHILKEPVMIAVLLTFIANLF